MAEAETEYNAAIAQAEYTGEYELAAALYEEKVRVQEALTEAEIHRLRNELEQYQRQHQTGQKQTVGASKANIAQFSKNMTDIGYITKGFDDYDGDAETLDQMYTAFARMASEFPDEADGLTVQLSHTEDLAAIGWYEIKREPSITIGRCLQIGAKLNLIMQNL